MQNITITAFSPFHDVFPASTQAKNYRSWWLIHPTQYKTIVPGDALGMVFKFEDGTPLELTPHTNSNGHINFWKVEVQMDNNETEQKVENMQKKLVRLRLQAELSIHQDKRVIQIMIDACRYRLSQTIQDAINNLQGVLLVPKNQGDTLATYLRFRRVVIRRIEELKKLQEEYT